MSMTAEAQTGPLAAVPNYYAATNIAAIEWYPVAGQPMQVGLPMDAWRRTENGFELRYDEQPPLYQFDPVDTALARFLYCPAEVKPGKGRHRGIGRGKRR